MIGAWLAMRGVRRTYDALNRRDLDGFLAAWAPGATFDFPGDVWASGHFQGTAELRRWFERFLATFPGLRFTLLHVAVARPWTFGAANEVTVEWTIDLENRAGERLRNHGITAIVIRGAKVAAARDFLYDTGPRFRDIWGDPRRAREPPATDRDQSPAVSEPRRVGVFGWGIVAPLSRNVDAFARNLESPASWLEPFNGFGPSNFLVGTPDFDFADSKAWIDARFPPSRFPQLAEKMDAPTQYAIGAFIQALGQNPGIEEELRELGDSAHVYVGTSIGAVATIGRETVAVERAQRRWDRFWSSPERNAALRAWQAMPDGERSATATAAPPDPATVPDAERSDAEDAWHHYWAGRSPAAARLPRRAARDRVARCRGRRRRGAPPRAQGEAAAPPAAAGRVGRAAAAVERGERRPAVEHPQHAGGADLDARPHHRPRLRAGRRLRHLRRRPEARAGRHPPRRGEGGGRRRHRSATATDLRRRVLQRPRRSPPTARCRSRSPACAAPTSPAAPRSGSSATSRT